MVASRIWPSLQSSHSRQGRWRHGYGGSIGRRDTALGVAAGTGYRAPAQQRMPLGDYSGVLAENHLSEDGAETLVETEVNDEVDRGVGHD